MQEITPTSAGVPPVTSEVGSIRKKRSTHGAGGRPGETLAAYIFLGPFMIVLIGFTVLAALYGLYLSFFKVDIGFGVPEYVGLRNFGIIWNQLLTDGTFLVALRNTAFFAVVVVIMQTFVALMLALLLNQAVALRGVFRTLFYLPSVTSSVAVSIIFLWLYTPQGLLNYWLSLLQIHGPDWLGNPTTALPAIMLLNVFTTSPTFMILYLAALQEIPQTLYEAAATDGATRWNIFWNVTLPLLRPTTFLIVALGTIGSFQVFDQIKLMTEGGPLNSTLSVVYEIYSVGFKDNHFGLAAAMSVILFLIIMVVTLFQRRFIDATIQY